MKTVRVFIAHSKSDAESSLEDIRIRVETVLRNAAQDKAIVKTVLGRDDHEGNFKRCGSWDSWAQDVIDRIDYATREPVYKAVVVTNRFVGKATAQIVQAALRSARPILLFCDDSTLRPIRELRVASNDFRSGWEVIAS